MVFNAISPMRVAGAYGAIVGTLWSWISACGEPWGKIGFCVPEKIFLFESEPKVLIVIVPTCPRARSRPPSGHVTARTRHHQGLRRGLASEAVKRNDGATKSALRALWRSERKTHDVSPRSRDL